jgi:hypothetical protein
VNDLNEDPTDLLVSSGSFNENISTGSVVAELSSMDEDSVDTHTYSLVSGDGSEDNGSFEIVGDELKIKESPDFESNSSYSIRVQTKDYGGLTFEKSFTFSVNDLNEDPTDLLISASTFSENIRAGSVVAELSSTDEDSEDTRTYSGSPKSLSLWLLAGLARLGFVSGSHRSRCPKPPPLQPI